MDWPTLLIKVLPIACVAAVGGLLLMHLPRYFRHGWQVEADAPLPLRALLLRVLALLILSRALLLLSAYGMALWSGRLQDTLDNPLGAWIRWDANHYLGLAQNGYQNQGDPRFHIVFYPLYPLLVRIVSWPLGGNVVPAAFLASNGCLFLAGWALFRLVEGDYGRETALRALRYLMLCPLSLFFSLPYSEALFLLLSLASALMARRRRMGWAVLFGALAAATRLLGLLCAIPIFYAFIQMARERRGTDRLRLILQLARGFAISCLVALGFGAYLMLNKVVTGDPFRFLIYQREHWSQTFGSLHNSVRYTIAYLSSSDSWTDRYGIWGLQLASMLSVLGVMLGSARRVHPADGAYALVYYYVALSPTWLLSGPRYLTAMYPLYPMLALLTRKPWQRRAMSALLILLSAYCAYMYAVEGAVL